MEASVKKTVGVIHARNRERGSIRKQALALTPSLTLHLSRLHYTETYNPLILKVVAWKTTILDALNTRENSLSLHFCVVIMYDFKKECKTLHVKYYWRYLFVSYIPIIMWKFYSRAEIHGFPVYCNLTTTYKLHRYQIFISSIHRILSWISWKTLPFKYHLCYSYVLHTVYSDKRILNVKNVRLCGDNGCHTSHESGSDSWSQQNTPVLIPVTVLSFYIALFCYLFVKYSTSCVVLNYLVI